MRLVLLIILSLYFSNSSSNEQTSTHSFQLKNGMEVVVIENKRAPVIAQMIWYNFGSGIEETGKSGLDDQEGKLGLSDLENKLSCFLESVNNESQVNNWVGPFPLDEDIESQLVPSRYNDLCLQTIHNVLSEISQFKRRSPTSIADCDFSTVNIETSSTPIAIPLRTIHSAEDSSSYDLDLLNAVDLACRRMTYLESVQGYVEDQDFPGNDQFPQNFSLLSQRGVFSELDPSELLVEASGSDMPISVTSRG